MRNPVLVLPLVVAVVLIVYGRFNRRRPWGDWIALAGYSVLAITIVVALATGLRG